MFDWTFSELVNTDGSQPESMHQLLSRRQECVKGALFLVTLKAKTPACARHLKEANDHYEILKDNGYCIVGINAAGSAQTLKEWAVSLDLKFPVVQASPELLETFIGPLENNKVIRSYLLVDKHGHVIHKQVGLKKNDKWWDEVSSLVNDHSGTKRLENVTPSTAPITDKDALVEISPPQQPTNRVILKKTKRKRANSVAAEPKKRTRVYKTSAESDIEADTAVNQEIVSNAENPERNKNKRSKQSDPQSSAVGTTSLQTAKSKEALHKEKENIRGDKRVERKHVARSKEGPPKTAKKGGKK